MTINSNNNLIQVQKKIVVIGLDNVVVVETENVIMVINKNSSQEVKDVAKVLDK